MKNEQNPESVIIFGGSFNPPTLAHEQIIQTCLDVRGFDEVWVMPSGDRVDKQLGGSEADRLAMLHAVREHNFNNNPRLKISDFELSLPQPTETIRTIGALALAYPGTRFWFVFGVDSYESMPSWEYGDKLQKQLPMFLLPRDEMCLPKESETIRHLPEVRSAAGPVSSTKVREVIAQSGDTAPFVSEAVQRFIAQRNLYAS